MLATHIIDLRRLWLPTVARVREKRERNNKGVIDNGGQDGMVGILNQVVVVNDAGQLDKAWRDLPGEALLDKVYDGAVVLHRPDGRANVVGKTARPAYRDTHGTLLLLDFLGKDHRDVGTTREHLDRAGSTRDLSPVLGPRDEQHDVQDILAVRDAQDGVHPRPNPLERLVVAHDPDQRDAPRCHGTVVVALDEVAQVADLVRDARGTGEQHCVSVTVHAVVARVRAFESGAHRDGPLVRVLDRVVQLAREPRLGGDDKGYAGADGLLDLAGSFLLAEREELLLLLVVDPRDRERVVLPHVDRREADVGVRAGLHVDEPRKVHRDAHTLTRHQLHDGLGPALVGPVAVGETDHASQTVVEPDEHDGDDVRQLRESLASEVGRGAVHPHASKADEGKDDVDVEKGLIEGVADGGEREHHEHGQCDGAGHARGAERVVQRLPPHALPAGVGHLHDGPGNRVEDGVDHGHASDPAMEQVVRVEADVEHADQRVVSAGEDDQGDHVDDRKRACSSSELGTQRPLVLLGPVEEQGVDDVAADEAKEDEEVQARRQSSDGHGRRQLYLPVVSLVPERGVDEPLLHAWHPAPLPNLPIPLPLARDVHGRYSSQLSPEQFYYPDSQDSETEPSY
jgi:hypothetical protein